mgnify:CR=1 FL=1
MTSKKTESARQEVMRLISEMSDTIAMKNMNIDQAQFKKSAMTR